MKKFKYLFLIPLLLLSACKNNSSNVSTSSEESSNQPSEEVKPSEDLFEDFFLPENKVEIELDFTNRALLNFASYGVSGSTKKENMYHPCNMKIHINGDLVFNEVEIGARMKGNTSRENDWISKSGAFTKTQRFCNFKLSFSETFDDSDDNDYYIREWESDEERGVRKDRRLGKDTKKIDLKWNKNYDNTFTKEAYALEMYRNEGIIAQKYNLVTMTVKDEVDSKTAVFLAYEAVDKQLLKHTLPKGERDGNLYKLAWSADFTTSSVSGTYVGVEEEGYYRKYELKTNEDIDDHTQLIKFINVINSSGSPETIKPKIDQVVDVEYILKYFALQWVAGDPDDFRNNTNNTYIYFNSDSGKLMIIPYDNDRVFGTLKDWPIDTSNIPWYSTKMAGQDRAWITNPLYWRLILTTDDANNQYSSKWPVIQEYRETYYELCQQYAQKYLNVDKFQKFTDRFASAPSKDISKNADNLTFETYARNKKETLKA